MVQGVKLGALAVNVVDVDVGVLRRVHSHLNGGIGHGGIHVHAILQRQLLAVDGDGGGSGGNANGSGSRVGLIDGADLGGLFADAAAIDVGGGLHLYVLDPIQLHGLAVLVYGPVKVEYLAALGTGVGIQAVIAGVGIAPLGNSHIENLITSGSFAAQQRTGNGNTGIIFSCPREQGIEGFVGIEIAGAGIAHAVCPVCRRTGSAAIDGGGAGGLGVSYGIIPIGVVAVVVGTSQRIPRLAILRYQHIGRLIKAEVVGAVVVAPHHEVHAVRVVGIVGDQLVKAVDDVAAEVAQRYQHIHTSTTLREACQRPLRHGSISTRCVIGVVGVLAGQTQIFLHRCGGIHSVIPLVHRNIKAQLAASGRLCQHIVGLFHPPGMQSAGLKLGSIDRQHVEAILLLQCSALCLVLFIGEIDFLCLSIKKERSGLCIAVKYHAKSVLCRLHWSIEGRIFYLDLLDGAVCVLLPRQEYIFLFYRNPVTEPVALRVFR